MKRKISVLLTSVAIAALAQAQDDNAAQEAAAQAPADSVALTVPQVKPGECQALVVVPAKFEPRTEQVVIKDAAKSYEIVPAEYEWTEEQVRDQTRQQEAGNRPRRVRNGRGAN